MISIDKRLLDVVKREYEISELQSCLNEGANPNVYDETKNTCLHLLGNKSNTDDTINKCKLLLQYGASPNSLNDRKDTAFEILLHSFNDESLLDLLIQQTNLADKHYGVSLLTTAVAWNNNVAVRKLIAAGVDTNIDTTINPTLIEIAVKKDFIEMIDTLIDNGIDINEIDVMGRTPLIIAVIHSKLGSVRKLIERKASVKIQCAYGFNALAYACKGTNTAIIELLLPYFDVNEIVNNYTPLGYAAPILNKDVIQYLLEHGASPNTVCKDHVSYTPLHFAARQHRIDIIELLLKYGADINCYDSTGMTPLKWVADTSLDAVKVLLRHGANPVLKTKGHSVFSLTKKYNKTNYKYIKDYCFNIQFQWIKMLVLGYRDSNSYLSMLPTDLVQIIYKYAIDDYTEVANKCLNSIRAYKK